ncbi:MAG: tetratricopeptide repeat protein, partial [Clostridiales bacterium]|nr:tetratricopeptide repeat protein [Clostridiales bacterium]
SCYAPLRPYQKYGRILGIKQQISENAKLCFTSGKQYLTKCQYDKALKCFEEALEQEKDWAEALYYCGYAKYKIAGSTGVISELLLQSGGADDIAKALDYEPELIPQAEKDFELNSVTNAFNDRVIDVYLPEGKFEGAIRDLKQCIRINPTHVYPYLTMAEVYVASENVELALEWLQKAVLIDATMKDKIDGFSCFASLRTNATYRELFVKETMPEKSYYQLIMTVEPGGMREYFHMRSGNITHIRQAVLARLKMDFGLYALLS